MANPYAKEITNDKYKTETIWSKELFGYNTEGSNSYRIPGILRTHDNKIMIGVDKRVENLDDNNNTIEQVYKSSSDNGQTWSNNKNIIKIKLPKLEKD